MATDLKTWTKDLFSITGATLAGPAGALIGSLSGGLFAALVPGASDPFSKLFNQTTNTSLESSVSKLLERLDPVEGKTISLDLQIALRAALREAIYDLGGERCFPQVWGEKPRQVPARYTYLTTPQGERYADDQLTTDVQSVGIPGDASRTGYPPEEQISRFLKEMLNAIAEQRLLPLAPLLSQPVDWHTHFYQQTETPQAITEAFFNQVFQPFWQRFSTLVNDLGKFDRNLRHDLTDRMLVHLGEMLKARASAWSAYNRLVLETLHSQIRPNNPDQAEIITFLDGLLGTPATAGMEADRQAGNRTAMRLWTDLLADLITTAGRLETQSNGGFHAVLTHLGGQPDEVDLRFKLLLVASASEPTSENPIPITDELPAPGSSPYKGLQSYTIEDAVLFFGREKIITRLIDRLSGDAPGPENKGSGENFLAVIGMAGCGKSSLVQAGLLPAMQQKRFQASATGSPADSNNFWVFSLSPTAHPLYSLADSLVRQMAAVHKNQSAFGIPELVDTMLTDADSLNQILGEILCSDEESPQTMAEGTRRHLLLIVDQFEEVFTLCNDETERRAFIDNLMMATGRRHDLESTGAAEVSPWPVSLVIVFRAEFYARCTDYENLRQAIGSSQEFIGPMSAVELRRAIEEPARRNGWEFESGLVSVILHDLGADEWPVEDKILTSERHADFLRRYPPQPNILPAVSHTLLETWKHRRGKLMTLESYAESGGVQDAIAKTAESTFEQLDAVQKAIARKIFLQLIAHPAATARGQEPQAVCCRIPVAELMESLTPEHAPESPNSDEPIQQVLQGFAQAGLITIHAGAVEIAHEALMDKWPRLRKWLDEQMESVRLYQQIVADAREWHRNNHDPTLAYRGARLNLALKWADENKDRISSFEKDFLEFSGFVNEREGTARAVNSKARRQSEIESARKQAEAASSHRKSAVSRPKSDRQNVRLAFIRRFIRTSLVALTVLAAIFAMLVAWDNRQQKGRSDRLSETALQNQVVAQAASTQAFSAKITAQADAATHATAEANALSQKGVAEEARAEAERQSRNSHVLELAALATGYTSQDADLALLLGVQALEMARVERLPALREAQTALFHALQVTNFKAVLRGHTDQLLSATYSADNQYLLTTSRDHTARLWDLNSGSSMVLREYTGGITSAAFSPDGSNILTTGAEQGQDGVAELWSLDGTRIMALTGHTGQVNWGAFNPDGTLILTAGQDKTARLWQLDGTLVTTLTGHTHAITSAVFSPDQTRLLTLSEGATAWLWATNGTSVATLTAHAQPILAASFNPDGSRILTASADGTARLWLADGTPIASLQGHTSEVTSAVFNPNGQLVLTASADGTARLWRDDGSPVRILTTTSLSNRANAKPVALFGADGTLILTAGGDSTAQLWTSDGLPITTLSGHTDIIYNASFNADGSQVVTASADHTARIWDISQLYPLVLSHDPFAVTWAGFSPDGTQVLTAGEDGVARLYQINGTLQTTFSGHRDALGNASFSPDGQLIATASRDGTARIWRTDGTFMVELRGHTAPVGSVNFSPDSKHVVTASEDGTARLYRVSGSSVLTLEGHTGEVSSAFFSPEGSRIVTASLDGTALIWSLDGQVLSTIYNNDVPVSMANFSPDGQRVLTAGQDGIARLWLADGTPLVSLEGHTGSVNWAAFSPDGKLIATAGLDGMVRLWTMDGNFLASAVGHTQSVLATGFSLDGKHLITSSWDGSVRLWNTFESLEAMQAEAIQRVGRWLRQAECQRYLRQATCPEHP